MCINKMSLYDIKNVETQNVFTRVFQYPKKGYERLYETF